MNFHRGILEIRVQYQGTPTENTLEKPKKKVPPSKIRRNRQRLSKFLEKKIEPNLPPATSHEISDRVEGAPTPPLNTPPPGPCEENSCLNANLQCDTKTACIPTRQSPPIPLTRSQLTWKIPTKHKKLKKGTKIDRLTLKIMKTGAKKRA